MGSFLWFFVGAGAATMYARRQNQHEGTWSHHSCHRTQSSRNITPPPSSEVDQTGSTRKEPFFPSAPWNNPAAQAAVPSSSLGHPSTSPSTSSPDPWAAEKERMREIGSQLGDNVLEFSESTLDTLLSSIASMKAKLVQQRLEREGQDQKAPSPRLV
ncbi:hypothetical protein F5878DRAFT_613728 [Lentinula raphanica]|uniref:Uncharacterized protein n=1 Tax=Lentinula raphanica TaxID=153919 RepID=A0AA38UJ27_9AGAR|nr:hypothetical protein F5878DRAFT_613728 [Lentinula raphanica]